MPISEQAALAALTPARRTLVHPRDRVHESGPEAPGAVCHALCVRFTGTARAEAPYAREAPYAPYAPNASDAPNTSDAPYAPEAPYAPDELSERFASLAAALLSATATGAVFPAAARLWRQPVPCRSDAPDAERWRTRELARPLVAHRDAAVRAVLLTYADDVAELVVVAHRAVLGAGALGDFTAELLGRTPVPATAASPGGGEGQAPAAAWATPDPAAWVADLAGGRFDARPDWGLGRPSGPDTTASRVLTLPAGAPVGDTGSWSAALGIVLARYEGLTRPVLPALVTDPFDAHGVEGVALVAVDADPAHTLGTVDERVRAGLAGGPAWHTEDLRRELASVLGDSVTVPAVGIVVQDDGPADFPGADPVAYRPFQRAPFPVTLSVTRDAAHRRELRCDFSARTLRADIADQLLRHVCRVHRTLVESPDTPVASVEPLDEDELDRTAAPGRHDPGRPARRAPFEPERIDTAIAALAASRPDAVAVSFEGSRLSYGELDHRADRLAHALRRLGVADGDRIGVCLERSAELIVTLLAVLKAGATYVPMDPAYPRDRLSYTAADAELGTVVADFADFPGGDSNGDDRGGDGGDGGVRVIGTAALAELAPEACDGPPPSATGPQDPAYVIYTSGSTGRPKGVVIPHVNVLGLMAATTDDFGLGADDIWTLFHSSAFDFSVWEIWGCLLTGGRLVVVPYWVSRSPEEFHRLLVQERVSVLSQTPSAFAHLLDVERDGAEPVPVRLVVLGGEGLEPRMLLPWFDRHPETVCRVVNMYGITETTVHVTAQTVTRAEALTGSKSVGHALPGWWVRVADRDGRPLPFGVAGEIQVGGAGLAAHYLNRPDLTGQRFLRDPRTGERLYRSGDKGRLLPDGRLEHLGRLDNQVKLRGFRIELDEIRAVLLDDPLVGAAVVVLNRTDPEDRATARLDAFVVLEGVDTEAVRQRAARYLPEYMVPSTVTALDRMPLTTNGKLDAAGLPRPAAVARPARPDTGSSAPAPAPVTVGVPDTADGAGDTSPAAPEDALTAALLDVWQEVLGVPVGPDDNFFDLGGNSLLAMRVGAALRRRGGPTVSMRDLYTFPTIRRLTAGRAG
ncbi:amino acid adenylation domain-containing protein [Streptomyces sp. NBC_01433]|uniref:amino acid adenylation domain-containing protein n=1 Tax=Streptomyces sp. NBC_01433 TaxID=2903864 RepID=UPI0022573549|nr:amino acid adenylation domain-containing protein [Streptomyces sp. NBC_01433]MCX4676100.1 amino acid adenylation domain-containing protein [Streptomyces sp. NBC_01433]